MLLTKMILLLKVFAKILNYNQSLVKALEPDSCAKIWSTLGSG